MLCMQELYHEVYGVGITVYTISQQRTKMEEIKEKKNIIYRRKKKCIAF